MSPLWGFGYLVHAACYKHAAPLGLKAPVHQNSRQGIHRRGLVSSPSGLGDPTATVSIPLFSASLPLGVLALNIPSRITRTHVAPLGLWLLDMPPCYKHAAPLGLKAPVHQNSRHGIHRRGLVSSPDGLGDPTATVSIPLFSASLPLGVLALNFLHVSREHMSPLWGFGY